MDIEPVEELGIDQGVKFEGVLKKWCAMVWIKFIW
jgi:hypothetical protein